MDPKVSIVIVTWNGEADLRLCLESLKGLDYDNYDITVVDNASKDGTCQMLRSEFSYVRLIALDKNAGRSEGLNIGTAQTDGKYVLHLDNDVKMTDPRFLRTLVEAMEQDEAIGACGPTVLDKDSDRIQATGGTIDFKRVTSSYHSWVGQTDYKSLTDPIECDYIVGCAALFRRSAMDRVGHYDSRYVVYWDDSDICIMMKEMGMKVVSIPSATISHKVGGSGGARSAFAYFHCAKNRIIFMRKHGKLADWPGFLVSLALQPWPGDSKRRRLKYWRTIYPSMLKAIWWNIRDAVISRGRTQVHEECSCGCGPGAGQGSQTR
ncbi:MAG: glycosyltransferase family 2 protein [Armatimonadota bacterium]|nr:glycosyltransferase family 2 protein [Armatimonadota bacterium]